MGPCTPVSVVLIGSKANLNVIEMCASFTNWGRVMFARANVVGFCIVLILGISSTRPCYSQKGSDVIVASIVESLGAIPEANVDLGKVKAGSAGKFQVQLVNRTSEEIAFDNIVKGCKCVDVSTSASERIGPGESMTLRFSQKIGADPAALDGGGVLFFRQKEAGAFKVNYVFSLQEYVGLSDELVLVTTDGEKEIKFDIGLVLSEDVGDEDFELSVLKIPGDFEYRVQREENIAACKFSVANTISGRVYGAIRLVDLRTGRIVDVPFVMEQSSAIKVYPRFLKFSRADVTGDFVSRVFVRHDAKDMVENKRSCVVSAKLGDVTLPCIVKTIGREVSQIEIQLSASKIDAWKENRSSTKDTDRQDVAISVRYGSDSLKSNLPFSILDLDQ